MKHKPDASWNGDSTERPGVRKSLTRAGVQLGYAVTGVLTSSLEALEERLESGPASGGTAQNRMRELLNRDRAMLHTRRVRPGSNAAATDAAAYGFTGKESGGTARGRMRELLSQDRAQLATLDEEPFAELFEQSEQSGTVSLPPAPRSASPITGTGTVAAAQQPSAPPAAGVGVTPQPAPLAGVPTVTVMRAPVMVGAPAEGKPPAVAVAFFEPPAQPTPAPASVAPGASVVRVVTVFEPNVEPVAPALAPQPVAAPPETPAPIKKAMPALRNQVPVGSAPVPAPATEEGESPIRTRSMARLLALQGYRDKALAIYDDLVAAEPDNAELRAEADRLRG